MDNRIMLSSNSWVVISRFDWWLAPPSKDQREYAKRVFLYLVLSFSFVMCPLSHHHEEIMATPVLGTQVVCWYTCYYLHMYMAKYDNLNVCVLGYRSTYLHCIYNYTYNCPYFTYLHSSKSVHDLQLLSTHLLG